MRTNPDANGASAGNLLKIIVVVVALMFGGPMILIAAVVFFVMKMYKKKQEEEREAGDSVEQQERQQNQPLSMPVVEQASFLEERAPVIAGRAAPRAARGLIPVDHDRHAQELQDLLRAGIIEQDEYNERMQQMKR